MVEKQSFNDKTISKGSLVFIIYKNKPYKTGWWFKTNNYNKEDEYASEGIYVLVKNITDYDEYYNDKSRIEYGKYLMKSKTLRNSCYYDNQYETMAVITGVESIILQEDNYKLTSRIFWDKSYLDSKNVRVTDRFIKLLEYVKEKEEQDEELIELAKHIKNN